MDPKAYFILGSAAVAVAIILIASRQFIRFRCHFGVWQGQRGARRLARTVMTAQVKAMAAASEARSQATEKFDSCVSLPAPMSSARKAMKKAERRERKLNRKYGTLCSLLKEFMMESEIKIADEQKAIEIKELRRAQNKLSAAK